MEPSTGRFGGARAVRARDLVPRDRPARWAATCGRGRCDWYDGDLYFTSGDGTRKSRDLAGNPVGTISVSLTGIDLVFEGGVSRVTDRPTLDALAVKYNKGGWPATVEGDALTAPFSAPSAGPPPWYVYEFNPKTVFGLATAEPYGATRWRL